MLILLWGLLEEAPLAAVAQALRNAGAHFAILDQRQVLKTRVEISTAAQISGRISAGALQIDLGEIAAAYVRPYESRLLTAVQAAGNRALAESRASAVDEILLNWSDITPALVLNRPRNMASNNAKPYQSKIIRRHGFLTPETLITTTPEAAREFHARHGDIIYKSVSGTRSRVTRLSTAHADRLHDIQNCPTQFQQFIPGRDFRAHVVGPDVFVSELVCDADDYRYPNGQSLQIRAATLPVSIETRCVELARSMSLHLAGIDLRRTPSGEWYCFEVNPSPAFTFYQESTGQPIAAAIASFLMIGDLNCEPVARTAALPDEPLLLAMDESLCLLPASIWKN